MLFGPCAFVDGAQQIARFKQGFGGVYKHAGFAQAVAVGLAHGGGEAADQVQMGAGLQPFTANERGSGQRGAADDVGTAHGGFQVRSVLCSNTLGVQAFNQGLGAFGVAVPDLHRLKVAHAAVGVGQQAGDAAGAHHKQFFGIRSAEPAGSQR